MRKIILFLSGLALLYSTGYAMAASNGSAYYGTTITGVNDINPKNITYAGVTYPYVDGDFRYNGSSGGVYESNTFIITDSPHGSGSLYVGATWFNQENKCSISGQLKLPIKVENNRIVLPPTKWYRIDNLTYSDEKCRTLGITHLAVAVEDGNVRYIIKSYANG